MTPEATTLAYFLLTLAGLLAIVAVQGFVEANAAAGRLADRLLTLLFGEPGGDLCCLGRSCDRCRGIVR